MHRDQRFTIRISPRERQALELIAIHEGLTESSALRRLLRLAMIDAAPLGIFPAELMDALHLNTKRA